MKKVKVELSRENLEFDESKFKFSRYEIVQILCNIMFNIFETDTSSIVSLDTMQPLTFITI